MQVARVYYSILAVKEEARASCISHPWLILSDVWHITDVVLLDTGYHGGMVVNPDLKYKPATLILVNVSDPKNI